MMTRLFLIMLVVFAVVRCGVKSDPLPPLTEPELGRGQPTFKRALRNVNVPKDAAADTDDEDDEDQDEEK